MQTTSPKSKASFASSKAGTVLGDNIHPDMDDAQDVAPSLAVVSMCYWKKKSTIMSIGQSGVSRLSHVECWDKN